MWPKTLTLAAVLLVAGIYALADSRPAAATIHEGPVASWCSILASGNITPLIPPGLTPEDGKGPDSNVATPLFASGMVSIVPYTGPGFEAGDVELVINEDHPAVHTLVVGDPIEVDPGFWIAPFIPDPSFPAFANCPNLLPGLPG